jgi:hypothetical protein
MDWLNEQIRERREAGTTDFEIERDGEIVYEETTVNGKPIGWNVPIHPSLPAVQPTR